jgi:hypothetical protein
MYFGIWLPTFPRNILSPSSWWKRVEAACSSEMLVTIYQTTHIAEDCIVHIIKDVKCLRLRYFLYQDPNFQGTLYIMELDVRIQQQN